MVDFKNTVIIMTTNLGTRDISKGVGVGFSSGNDTATGYERMKSKVTDELKQHFRPEFLNRVDDIVLFKPLTLPQIERIVELQFDELRRRLADRRLTLELTEPARRLIAAQGFDPVYGARPLRRFISHEVETRIGRALLGGEVRDGATVRVDARGEELVVTYQNPPQTQEAA
jgi:ATP-dependent Clp protease ATP-binding subunit ClpB